MARTPYPLRWLPIGAALWLTTVAAPVQAHMGSTKYVEARPTDGGAALAVEIDAIDAGVALGIGTRPTPQALHGKAPVLSGWLASGMAAHDDQGPCSIHPGSVSPTSRDGKPFVRVELDVECKGSGPAITLRDETVFDDDPNHQTIVAEGDDVHVLSASAREARLFDVPSASATAAGFVYQGAVHLVTGFDHLLFLLSLLLPAGLMARRLGLRPTLKEVAWVVTAFTVGHSISLIAATFGWLSLPSQWVESVIAASIVVVAGINLAKPEAMHGRPGLALGFGLVHGFGFSSVLAEVGLPVDLRALAVLSFNVGIELAQLVFVALALVPLTWLASHRRYRHLGIQAGSAVIAGFGLMWLIERVTGG